MALETWQMSLKIALFRHCEGALEWAIATGMDEVPTPGMAPGCQCSPKSVVRAGLLVPGADRHPPSGPTHVIWPCSDDAPMANGPVRICANRPRVPVGRRSGEMGQWPGGAVGGCICAGGGGGGAPS